MLQPTQGLCSVPLLGQWKLRRGANLYLQESMIIITTTRWLTLWQHHGARAAHDRVHARPYRISHKLDHFAAL